MIYDKSATAGLNHCEETGGSAGGVGRGGGPPILPKNSGPSAKARRSQLVVLGYFLRDEARRGTRGLRWSGSASARSRTCSRTHTYTHRLEPMGGEEWSHIRAQPCLIMDLMETLSAESVSTCAAPDSSQLFFFSSSSFFFNAHTVFTHIPPHQTRTHTHTHHLHTHTFACINSQARYT